jgi:hypothetical protein
MNSGTTTAGTTAGESEGANVQANDRLYSLMPALHRMRDADLGEPLRALLGIISEQVNIVEDDITQLYENWFIETCQDWVVPYIADLIGYQPVHAAGRPGEVTTQEGQSLNRVLIPRREVARTIGMRRRKGTLRLLEDLAESVSGWPSRAVEFYLLLAATQHIRHTSPLHLKRGGTANVRDSFQMSRLDGPFDTLAHTADVRRVNSRRKQGLHNIPSVGLFVWRLRSYPITQAPAYCVDRARNRYTFSVLGNNCPLLIRPREQGEGTGISGELDVPSFIERAALERRFNDYYGPDKSLCIWRDGMQNFVPQDKIIVADLSEWAYQPQRDQVVVDPRLGRIAFSPRTSPKMSLWVTYHYGFSAEMGGGQYHRPLSPVGERRLYSVSARAARERGRRASASSHYRTINEALARWYQDNADDAVIEIDDNEAYVEPVDIALRAGQTLELRAANGMRPTIHLRDWTTNRADAMLIRCAEREQSRYEEANDPYQAQVDGPYHAPDDEYGETQEGDGDYGQDPEEPPPYTEEKKACAPRIILDGLLIEGRSLQVQGDPANGDLSAVTIRHCTLVPGWSVDEECEPENGEEPSLELNSTKARVTIEKSILGSVLVVRDEVTLDPMRITLVDSILDATSSEYDAVYGLENRLAHATLVLKRCTVLGRVRTHAIELAENTILDGGVTVARRQVGCVRFCYVYPGSRTPRRYRCQPDMAVTRLQALSETPLEDEEKTWEERRVRPLFNSRRYGTPTYLQLNDACAEEIKRGAEDESEMGAFHDLFNPQREANLRARLEEYTPAGADVGIIYVT